MNWKKVKLGDVLQYEQPTKYIVASDNYDNTFRTPVLTAGKSFILGYTNESYGIFTNFPVIIFDDFTTVSKYVDFPFKVKSSAMKILKVKEDVADIRFIYYLMQTLNVDAEQHKRYWISKFATLEIPLPPLATQKRIAEILDAADALKRKDQELLKKYDELAQAIFIDMFGDPVKNEKGWEVKELKQFGKVQTGNTPPRAIKEYYGSFIEWIKTDNILLDEIYPRNATEYLSEKGLTKGRSVEIGSVLVTCIAGSSNSIGNVILTNRKVAFNQQINSLTPNKNYNSIFIYSLFRYCKEIIQESTTQGMKRIITKSTFENIKFISPPLDLQNKYEEKYLSSLKGKDNLLSQLLKSETLFDSLIQKAFKGELVN